MFELLIQYGIRLELQLHIEIVVSVLFLIQITFDYSLIITWNEFNKQEG